MNGKRGLMLVGLGLFILLIYSNFVFGYELIPAAAKFKLVDLGTHEGDDYDEVIIISWGGGWGDESSHINIAAAVTNDGLPLGEGCRVHVCEYDKLDANDCGTALYPPGRQLTGLYQNDLFDWPLVYSWEWNDAENDFLALLTDSEPASSDGNAYMCGSDSYWYQCALTNQGEVFWMDNPEKETCSIDPSATWGSFYDVCSSYPQGSYSEEFGYYSKAYNNILFNCTMDLDNNIPIWREVDYDADHDGYTAGGGDCDNNPSDDPLQCADLKLPQDCNGDVLKYSTCAICIHPQAPEVCGDGINNDCKGTAVTGFTHEEDIASPTPDDCNYNQYACEQQPAPVELGLSNPNEMNFYNQEFSWMKGEQGQSYCCGYNKVSDLGKTLTNAQGEYICLNKNLVGSGGDFTAWSGVHGYADWWWVSANSNDVQFKVLTVKNPGTQPYDLVSDSQNWRTCNSTNAGNLISDNPNVISNYANHFYCYQEGQHWSWAECYGAGLQSFNQNVKGRNPGDGAYSLFLGESSPGQEFVLKGTQTKVSSEKGQYADFYSLAPGKESAVTAKYDFSGYDYLEFFARVGELGTVFTPSQLPADVRLEIYGISGIPATPNAIKPTKLFDQNVLGYTTNSPFLGPDNWMHVKVPIPNNLQGVSHLIFTSIPTNKEIQIKNVYLSKKGEQAVICSGSDDPLKSSWLTSFDDGSANSQVNGEQMCKLHYGDNAWLGNQEEVGTNNPSAPCCGNDENEYYAGSSKTGYGCWNSLPIGSGNTTMNVEFKLSYNLPNIDVSYSSADLSAKVQVTYKDSISSTVPFNLNGKSYGTWVLGNPLSFPLYDVGGNKLSRVEFIETSPAQAKFYFFNTLTGELDEGPITSFDYDGAENYVVLGELRELTSTSSTSSHEEELFSYPCNQETCYFPLRGQPLYKITNPNPELYELYFLQEGKEPKLITQTQQPFDSVGMLMAKKVAQQVVYINTEAATNFTSSSTETEQGFYGCEAADFLTQISPENNLPYCSIKANLFCSPSVVHKQGADRYTTINSWSSEELNQIGYEEPQLGVQNLSDFAQGLELVPQPIIIYPEQRNHSAPLLPGRNIISNAGLYPSGKEIPHWTLLNSLTPAQEHLEQFSEGDYKAVLKDNEILQSEKIPLPGGISLSFSYNGSATSTLYVVNRNGVKSEVEPSFQVEDNSSYFYIEFGNGEVYHPLLQYVDSQGPNTYNYNNKYSERGGAACCPAGSCWNGYLCVKDMSESTSLFEPVNLARNYRCIHGKWEFLPPKMDWTQDPNHWGYCQKEDQCFVLASALGGIESNTAKDFYNGDYPTCINSGEYLFDHYCENGVWTSRTKFLAQKMAEVGENNDYTLYCSNYKNTLPDYTITEPYLGGRVSQQVVPQEEIPLSMGVIETQAVSTCFDKIMDGEGKRLVKDDDYHHENTCVNNVCILKYTESGVVKTAFATTLNQPINGSDSFLQALGVPLSQVETACNGEVQNGFVHCTLPDLEGDLWYSPELNALVYGKGGIQLSPGLFQKALDWFKNLFGIESPLSSDQHFVQEAQNFREVYLSAQGEKKVRAMIEFFSQDKQTLIAEYENYDTPICSYLFNRKAPAELEVELFNQVSGQGKLVCTKEGTVQRVEAIAGIDFLWPQLTAQLRPAQE